MACLRPNPLQKAAARAANLTDCSRPTPAARRSCRSNRFRRRVLIDRPPLPFPLSWPCSRSSLRIRSSACPSPGASWGLELGLVGIELDHGVSGPRETGNRAKVCKAGGSRWATIWGPAIGRNLDSQPRPMGSFDLLSSPNGRQCRPPVASLFGSLLDWGLEPSSSLYRASHSSTPSIIFIIDGLGTKALQRSPVALYLV